MNGNIVLVFEQGLTGVCRAGIRGMCRRVSKAAEVKDRERGGVALL